jgi:hypothetical protein
MHWFIKYLWICSIFGILFFVHPLFLTQTYLSIITSQQPQFLPFKPKSIDSTINTCIIVDMVSLMPYEGLRADVYHHQLPVVEASAVCEEDGLSGDD